MRVRSIFNPGPVYLPTCRPADLPTIQNIHTWLILYYKLRGVSIFSSWSVYVPTCRPADLPTCRPTSHSAYTYIGLPYSKSHPSLSADLPSHLLFYVLYISIFNPLPFYLPTCRHADPSLILILNIDKPLCMYIKDERWVGGSAGRQVGT